MILGLTKRIIVLDAETSSSVDLKKHGAARYWRDLSTRVLMLGFQDYTSDQEFLYEPRLHDLPKMLVDAAALPPEECMFAAFNAAFDYEALEKIGRHTTKDKWIDIMMLAYMLSFAGGLDDVLAQFDVRDQYGQPLRKSPEGKRLIQLFCKREEPWYYHPTEWDKFRGYCRNDVHVEVELLKKCCAVLDQPVFHPMVRNMHRQWLLNQRINARGIPVSLKTIAGGLKIKASETRRLLGRIKEITGLDNPNSVQQLSAWCANQEYPLENMQAAYVRECLEDPEIPDQVAEVLRMRLMTGKASVKKFDAFRDKQLDGRIHNAYTLCGASRTGRDASRGINFANLERGKLKDPMFAADVVDFGDARALSMWLDGKDATLEPLDVLGSIVRAVIKAPEGMGVTAVDLKSIESVGLAWLAGCGSILDLFHEGKDTYKDFATRFYGILYEAVTKAQRTFCKPAVLGCGYGASGTALVLYAKGLGVELDEDTANKMVAVFRSSFPEIPLLWRNLEKAAKDAINNPGTEFRVYACDVFSEYGDKFHTYKEWPFISYFYDGTFLYCGLPSGRTLFYYKPEILQRQMRSKKKDYDGNDRYYFVDSIHYWGKDQDEAGAWRFISTWGGMMSENVTQAACRDILYHGLELIDQDPLIELVGSTYDESICLTRLDDTTCYERIKTAMTTPPPWLDKRFFLGADGYCNSPRYKKD